MTSERPIYHVDKNVIMSGFTNPLEPKRLRCGFRSHLILNK